MHFWSDNSTGVAPEIMDALVRANEGVATAYGTDEATGRLTGLFSELFETEVSVFPVATGTAANGLALSLLVPQYGLILCHHDSEVNVHSCASPEFYTGGAKTVALRGAAGRLDIAEVKAALDHFPKGYVHGPQPAALNPTKTATILKLLRRPKGASIAQLQKATDWQAHNIRAALTGLGD